MLGNTEVTIRNRQFRETVNKHQVIQKRQSEIGNSEKLATQGTQYEDKHNIICAGHQYMQTNTINVNKTRAPYKQVSSKCDVMVGDLVKHHGVFGDAQ